MNDSMDLPHTPLHSPKRFVLESPFSDYYTEPSCSPCLSLSDSPHKALSHRLRQIWSQISSAELSTQTTALLNGQLDALETTLTAPESQSRQPADIAESGLFVDDDDEEEVTRIDSGVASIGDDGSPGCDGDGAVAGSELRDVVLKKAQTIASRVANVAAELRSRCEEAKHINDLTISRLEAAVNEVLHLRTENESLRSDISSNHSELLFLKLQLKLLEAQTAPFAEQVEQSLVDGLERWKLDWIDVEQRFHGRRDRYADEDADGGLNGNEDVQEECPTLCTHETTNGHVETSSTPKKLDITRQELDARAETTPLAMAIALGAAKGEVNEPDSHLTSLHQSLDLMGPPCTRHSRDRSQTLGPSENEAISFDQQAQKQVKVRVKRIIIKNPQEKTPWQELWEGLYALTGMDRD